MFDGHQHRAAPFTTDADSLEHAEHQQQHRRPHADRCVSWQQPDQEGGDAHDQEGEHQHGLAADAVAVVAEDDAADWTRDEADEKGRVGQQGPDQRIEVGKNSLLSTIGVTTP